MISTSIIVYLITGSLAGIMAGILGLGGGLVVVPGLFYVFTKESVVASSMAMHMATGTSLAIMIFTSLSAVRFHHKKSDIRWLLFRKLWAGLIAGALLGVIAAFFIPSEWLQSIFSFYLLFIAWKLFVNRNQKKKKSFDHYVWDKIISLLVGFFSSLLGIGGGSMMIPYLIQKGVPIQKTASIAALSSLTVALAGTLGVMLGGYGKEGLPAFSLGYVYWPAVFWVVIPAFFFTPLGVRLTYSLPSNQLKLVFIGFLIIMAIAMFF